MALKFKHNKILSTPMSLQQFFDFGISISGRLNSIHQKDFIHADIRPGNIRWDSTAKICELTEPVTIETQLSFLDKARLPYISPEQTGRMNRRIDYRTDLYSLGVVLYEMLVGKPPFVADDPLEMIHMHMARTPPMPHTQQTEVPEQISTIIMRLLEKNIDDRYQTAYGLKHDLEQCARLWKKNGSIKRFELGEFDLTGIFKIPQKLYGRENELKTLLDSFDRTSKGGTELLMVAGYSGVGKSVLVHEVQKPITAKRGFFIEGKFDQYQHNIPYFAWQQAFRALVNYLLMENDDRLNEWKTRILAAVGPNGKVITDIVRNLELVIGRQSEVSLLGGAEAQNRFNSVFRDFVKTVADKEHPLVIFLDDLHWIDSASLNLLQVLVSDPDLSHVQYIGAYRDNEVDAAHPLIVFLESLKEEPVVLKQITLQNLAKEGVNALIADTLQSSCEDTPPLAELIYSKTAGNAFFIHQILHTLNDENLLTFDCISGRWNWDLEALRALDISENVVEFLSTSMRKLPGTTQEILKLAACIGNLFDIETLLLIDRKPRNDVEGNLKVAIREGVIFPLNGHFKFAHDRVQQAAYSLIPEKVKKETHLEMGRILLERIPEDEREERIFDIVNQLNIGIDLLSAPTEKIQLVGLNLIAGNKAKRAAAYESALGYFSRGIELLGETAWENNYSLSLNLFTEAADVAFLSGEFDRMEELSDAVFGNARTVGEKIKIIDIKIAHETTQMNHKNAINIGLKYLRELGLDLNTEVTKEDVSSALAVTVELLSGQTVDRLVNQPDLVDPKLLYQVHIINSLLTPNYFSNRNLLLLTVCISIDIIVHHGNTPDAAVSYANFSMILSNMAIRQFSIGFLVGQVAIRMVDKSSNDAIKCPVLVTVYAYIFQYLKPLKSNTQKIFQAFQSGMDNGNLDYASYSVGKGAVSLFCSGSNLKHVLDETNKYTPFLIKYKLFNTFLSNCSVIALADYLRDPIRSSYLPEQYWKLKKDVMEGLGESRDDLHLFYNYQALQTLAFHFGRYAEAFDIGNEAHKCEASLNASYPTPRFFFYDTLACLRLSETTDEKQKELLSDRINRNMELLTQWAAIAPMNFAHMLHLTRAEQARIGERPETAAGFYEQAISMAKENGFNQDRALGYQLAAEYYKQNGFEEFYKIYTLKAYDEYREWGAIAIVKYLEKQNPRLFVGESSPIRDTPKQIPMDLDTVIKASQAIAGEIALDKLLAKMMHIVIENAGARNGFLVLAKEDKWCIEAMADVDRSKVQVLQSIRIEDNDAVSAGIIQYVARTHETIVLADAANTGGFTEDFYIRHHRPKSILCAPLVNKGKIGGIVYLENNLMTGVFTPERVELLSLLSSQMALALDNAQLYAEIIEREKRFRATFEQAAVGIAHVSLDGTFLRVNGKFCKIVGYPEEEMRKMTFQDITHPDDLDNDLAYVNQVLKGERKNYTLDKRYFYKDGSIVWVNLTVSLVFDKDGNPQYFVAVIKDISERKRAEEALRKSEAKYRGLVDNSLVGVFTSTLNGRFEFVNEAMARMYDFDKPEQMISQGSLERWSDLKARDRLMARLQKHGSVTNFETETITRRDRSIHIIFSAKLIGNNIFGMVMDITKRKQYENMIVDYQKRLKALAFEVTIAGEKERRTIATELHDYVSQSLALARIQIASARNLTCETNLKDKLDDISNTLFKALEDTQTLMLELGSHAIHEAGLSSAVSDWVESEIRDKYHIKTEVIDRIPENQRKTLAPNIRTILFRNVRELVINVVKHARSNRLSIRFEIKDACIRISIEDDGIGFDPRAEIQLENNIGGFGLFSIEELMTDLGGSLSVVSAPGKGCTAILFAPFNGCDNQGRD